MFTTSSKSAITLLVISAAEVMRVELRLGAKPAVRQQARAERPARTSLPAATELAISLLSQRPSRRTVVLAEDVWTGIVDVDDRAVQGLEDDEITQMLKFETQALSDLDPMTGHLGWIELAPVPPDTRRFWCTTVSSDAIAGVAVAVSLRGGKLAYCAHPIGLGSPELAGVPWIEFTRTHGGAFALGMDGLPRASLSSRSATSDLWYRALESNFGSQLPEQGWLFQAATVPPEYGGELELVEGEDVQTRWLTAVADRLNRPRTLPTLAPLTPATSTRTLTLVGAATLLVALVGCGTHLGWKLWGSRNMTERINALAEPAQEKSQLEGELIAFQGSIGTLEADLKMSQSRQADVQLVTSQRDRFSALLRTIAAVSNEHLVIDAISAELTGLRLSGRTIRSDAATAFAMDLSPDLKAVGWRVDGLSLKGSNQLVNGGPWDFTIDLVDVAPTEANPKQLSVLSGRSE